MIEKGKGNKYREKSIDKININVDYLVSDDEHESADDEMSEPISQTAIPTASSKLSSQTKNFSTNQTAKENKLQDIEKKI